MKDPLLGPLAAVAGGILVARFAFFSRSELLAAVAAFLILGILALWHKARIVAGACCCLGLFFAGALVALVRAPGPPPQLDAESREVVILGGCVAEPPAISGERERFILELAPDARAQVTLYAKEGEALPPLAYGENIELDARVRKMRNFGNPGSFNYANYLARSGIYWTASGAASTVRKLPGRCGSWFGKFIMDLRAAGMARIERLYRGNDYQVGIMQALLLGQTFGVQRAWTETYRNTGTFHTLVISGTHVAIVAAFLLLVLRLCFVNESLALLIAAASSWLYALVSGWGAPCVRSAAGLSLVMVAGYFYRERRPLNLLAAVALAFLVFDPGQLFEASFQLSFLAVAFLGVFATPLIRATSGPLSRGLEGLEDTDRDLHLAPRVAEFRIEMRLLAETLRGVLRLPGRVAAGAVTAAARIIFFVFEIVAVSAVIQVGLALPMVVYFHRVGLTGLSANAFIVPIMGVAVPVGFLAIFTGSGWIAWLGGWLLSLSQVIVGWHAALEPNWRIPAPPWWIGAAFAAALIACALARGRAWRTAAGVALALVLALLLWHPFAPLDHAGELEMTAIDVGQGDSILVVFPDGRRLLMDGGGIPAFGGRARAQLDIGEDVVAPYLWGRSIRTVDVVAVSHAHEDHIGGLPALVHDFHPRELWTGAIPPSPLWDKLRERARGAGARLTPLQAPARFRFGGAEIQVLAPLPGYLPMDTPKNNDSLVLRIRYGQHAFLLSGDAERLIEQRILNEIEVEPADILKVAHHGSRTSSTAEFLDAVNPIFAVISVGEGNSYGLPNRDVLDRLAGRGTGILRTDLDGLVSIRTDGRRIFVETYNLR